MHVADPRQQIGLHNPREPIGNLEEVRFAHRVTRILVEMVVRVEIPCLEKLVLEHCRRTAIARGLTEVVDKSWECLTGGPMRVEREVEQEESFDTGVVKLSLA